MAPTGLDVDLNSKKDAFQSTVLVYVVSTWPASV